MDPRHDTRFFGHPLGLSTLFFTEFWERFGYYGMRAVLILFLTSAAAKGGLGLDDSTAYAIYGLYTASVYGWSLPGGWVADRFLGQRGAVLYGGILIALGYLLLAVPSTTVFFASLILVIIGTGLLKPNISTIVGQLYPKDDPRREPAFSIFYMGINLGAFVAPLICGYLGEKYSWRLGFLAAGIGMTVGVIWYWFGQRQLGDAGLRPVQVTPAEAVIQRKWLTYGGGVFGLVLAAIAVLAFTGSLSAQSLNNGAGVVLLLVTLGLFGWMFFGADWAPAERKRITVIFVLFVASSLFWSAFEQAGSSLNLFAQRYTDTTIFGWAFPPSWLQSANAFFIVVLAAAFAWLWSTLGSRQPSSPMKFALGLLCAALGFLVTMQGAKLVSPDSRVSVWWLFGTYFFHTVGELCLSPVGLSAMTRLAPERVAGFMMGVWFLSISTGNYLGGKIAALYGDLPMVDLFQTIALFSVGFAVLLALIARPIARLER